MARYPRSHGRGSDPPLARMHGPRKHSHIPHVVRMAKQLWGAPLEALRWNPPLLAETLITSWFPTQKPVDLT